jgi:hypothetical protein
MLKKVSLICIFAVFLLTGCQVINSLQPAATAAASGSVLFQDDFSQNTNHWGLSNSNAGEVNFLYQGLDIKVNQADSMIWSVVGKSYADTKTDIDAVLLSGPTDDAYGTICRYEDNTHFYAFLVTHDGYYGIIKMQDGQVILSDPESGLKYSEVIRQGGVVNHIQAVCQGNKLSLSVNGQLLSEVEDNSFSAGQIGLIGGAYSTPGVEVFFDNLLVTQP